MLRHKFLKSLSLCALVLTLLLESACNTNSVNKSIENLENLATETQTTSQESAESTENEPSKEVSKQSVLEVLPLQNNKGEMLDKTDLTGKNVLVVFWTTWCHFCKAELASLNKLAKEYQDKKDFKILLVNVLGGAETEEKAESFLIDEGINLPLAFITQENSTQLGVPGFPFNFMLNKEGNLTDLSAENGQKMKYFYGATEEQLKAYIEQVVEA